MAAYFITKLFVLPLLAQLEGRKLVSYTTTARITELERTVGRILNLLGAEAPEAPGAARSEDEGVTYDAGDSLPAIADAVRKLGYELTDDDMVRVYEEFLTLAAKRSVTAKELDAIVAASAMQVPAANQLPRFVINSGNIITATASVRLEKDGATIEGISFGDGPIDAAFKAIEQVTNRHYELEDFRIDAVTEGKDAEWFASKVRIEMTPSYHRMDQDQPASRVTLIPNN